MKRRSIIMTVLIALLVLLPFLAQAAPVGKFTSIDGNVDVTVPGKPAAKASVGDLLNPGDIIRTKSKSKCEVTFIDGSILRLADSSRLRVTEFAQDEGSRKATLDLFRGKVQNIVKAASGAGVSKSRYEVTTPTAVAGVRGTNFFTFFQRGVSGTIFKEGTGYGYSRNRPQEVVTIKPGQAMMVTSPDMPPMVRMATDKELNQHEKDTAPSEKPKEGGDKGEGDKKSKESGQETSGAQGTAEEGGTPGEPASTVEETQSIAPPEDVVLDDGKSGVVEPTAEIAPEPPTEPYVPPQPVVASTTFSGSISGGMLTSDGSYVGSLTEGVASATIPDNTVGTMSASGTLTSEGGVPTVLQGYSEGTSDRGGAFYGPLAAVDGSWLNRVSALYLEGKNLYFLTGDATGTIADSTYSFSGSLGKSSVVGTKTLTPDPEETLLDDLKQNLSYEYTNSSFFGNSGEQYIVSDSTIGFAYNYYNFTKPYLITDEGNKVAVIGEVYAGSYFAAESTALPHVGYAGVDEYAVGSLSYSHDSANHHFTIDATLRSIGKDYYSNTWYLGNYAMRYLGMYDPAGAIFRMAGAGAYQGTPLAFGSAVGVLDNNGFQYLDSSTGEFSPDNPITGLTGLMGGTADLWAAPASFTMIGKYANPNNRKFWVMDMTSSDPYCTDGSCNIAGQPLNTIGPSFDGVGYKSFILGNARDDKMVAKGIGIYIKPTATSGSYETGYLQMDNIQGSFYPGVGMWEATGAIAAHSMGTTSIAPANLYDESPYLETHDFNAPIGDGAISGWLNGTSYYLDGQDWGVAAFGIAGDIDDADVPTAAWSAKFGKGKVSGVIGTDGWYRNYMLGTATGDAWDTVSKSFSLSALTRELNVEAAGSENYLATHNFAQIDGMYGGGTYEGVGTYVETPEARVPLTLNGVFNAAADPGLSPGGLFRPAQGIYYEGKYYYDDGNSTREYKFGYISVDPNTAGTGIGMYDYWDNVGPVYNDDALYLPNGIKIKRGDFTRSAPWDITNIEDIQDPDTFGYTYPWRANWYSEWAIEVLQKRASDTFDGVLGSTDWVPGGEGTLTAIGRYTSGDGTYNPTVFRSHVSGNFFDGAGATIGSYYGLMGGYLTDDARGVDGRLYGIYIGPNDATAGVLTGSYAGSLYKDIGMWDADGTVSADVMNSSLTGVTQADLASNLVGGTMFYEMAGRFDGAADGASVMGVGPFNATGGTLFIKGQDWGVYQSTIWTGFYGAPDSSYSAWSATLGGKAEFGQFLDSLSTLQFDRGGFLIPVTGTLAGDVVEGAGTGTFLTMTKMGTITADVLGISGAVSYADAYPWQGQAGGVWQKTQDLTFSSKFDGRAMRFTKEFHGESADHTTAYGYYQDSNYHGWIRHTAGTVETKIDYANDLGPFSTPMWEKFTYDSSTKTFSEYSRGTDGYPASFNDAFFQDIAGDNLWSAPAASAGQYVFSSDSHFSALMGGTGDLGGATQASPAPVYFLGEYENWAGLPQILSADIASYNVKDGTYTTLDGKGAYVGYLGGLEMNHAIAGRVYAIYLDDSDGNGYSSVNVLKGGFTGTAYPDAEMWDGQGGLYAVRITDDSTNPPEALYPSVVEEMYSSDYITEDLRGFQLNDTDVGDSSYMFQGARLFYPGNRVGVGKTTIGGSYSGITMADNWTASLGYYDGMNKTLRGWAIAGTKWSENTITGGTLGYGAQAIIGSNSSSWISVGEVMGSFNPAYETFQIGLIGVGIETTKFLEMAATDTGRASLQALNIPAIQVGTATLQQVAGGDPKGLTNVTMSNVGFFATSTGGAPSIWAAGPTGNPVTSGGVNGMFSVGTSALGATVPLSGGGLSANFGVVNWDTANNAWVATVNNGGGTLSGGSYNGSIQFQGAAAGSINPAGTFSGTAAGVAK